MQEALADRSEQEIPEKPYMRGVPEVERKSAPAIDFPPRLYAHTSEVCCQC